MQSAASITPISTASPLPEPVIESNEPVAVFPIASVAPLDGPPDGERINTFAIAPKTEDTNPSTARVLEQLRASTLRNPLIWLAAAVTLGLLVWRRRR